MSTLRQIRTKVRRLTATPSPLQLPDSEIDNYIDVYYEQDMPAELKLWNLHETYTFYTKPNEDKYTLPVNSILGVNPPVYIAGNQSFYTQSREQFFRVYPLTEFQQDLGSGDGTAGPYSFTLSNVPALRRSFYVSAVDSNGVSQTLVDIPLTESTGNIVAEGTTTPSVGTINYLTGAVTFSFDDTIDSTETISCAYFPYEASRPTAMLFYDDYFLLRPVPDKSYKVNIEAYRKPSQLLDSDSDSPDLDQWWQLIAFGAALKVLEDRQDTETLSVLVVRYDEQKQLALHRTILQQTPQRTPTIYSEQTINALGNSFRSGF